MAHTFPPISFSYIPDLPVVYLRRTLAAHRTSCLPNQRLFPAPSGDAGTILSGWLRAGLAMLGEEPAVGTVYASHSSRSGGLTSMRSVGIGLDAVAQWAGMTVETLTKSYNDAFADATLEAHYFFGRLLPRPLQLPA